MVLAFGHEPVAPLPDIQTVPDHADVGPLEAVVRNVLSIGCLSETIAVSIIRAEQVELAQTPLGPVLDSILADEVRHARFGWQFLEILPLLDRGTGPTRRLPRRRPAPPDRVRDPQAPVHPGLSAAVHLAGVCDGGFARQPFTDTIQQVIVPQLDALGLAGSAAWTRPRRPPDLQPDAPPPES